MLLPDGRSILAAAVTLPDGTALVDVITPNGEAPSKAATMPDGTIPNQFGAWPWSQWDSASMQGFAVTSFRWPSGMKLPSGSQLPDGSIVPDGAEPKPDGSVLFPDGGSVAAEDVTLPDGTKLIDVTASTSDSPQASATMPDGSKPDKQRVWRFIKWVF